MMHPLVGLRPLAALSLLLLAFPAFAQEGPGGPTTGSTSDLTGTMSAPAGRVKGLRYDATLGQRAPIAVGCAASAPAGFTMHYGWSCSDGTVTFDPPDAATTVARVAGPARVTIRCHLTATQSGSPTIHEGDATFGGGTGMAVAAIGGPLFLSADTLYTAASTFTHDHRDYAMPVYAQYFGYSHVSPPTDARLQLTQDAYASAGAQPQGTSMIWYYDSMYCPQLVGQFSTTLTTIKLQAESAGLTTVKCLFTYDDPDEHFTGFAYDDTDETPISPSDPSVTMVNQVDAHKPDSAQTAKVVAFQTVDPNNPTYVTPSTISLTPSLDWQNGQWIYGTYNSLLLKDNQGEQMPGVWIQERFTPNAPTYISTDSTFWTTKMPPSDETIYPWDSWPCGIFEYDLLSLRTYANYSTYNPATINSVHHYWAATKVVTPPPSGGIDVGTFTIHYVSPHTPPYFPYQTP